MKKITSACLLLFISTATGLLGSGAYLPTQDPRVTCHVHQLNQTEIEDLFFNQEALRFQERYNQLVDLAVSTAAVTTQAAICAAADINYCSITTSGPTAAEIAEHLTLKNLFNTVQAVKITVKNNSSTAIRIEPSRYILAYAQALTAMEKIIQLYPNFKQKKSSLRASGVAMAVFSAILGGVGLVTLVGACKAGSIKGGLFSLICIAGGIGLGVGSSESFRHVHWAKHLHKKLQRLAAVCPTLTFKDGGMTRLEPASYYTIPAGAEFHDLLVLNMASLNTSSAIFGTSKTEPALNYEVASDGPHNTAPTLNLW